MIDVPRLLTLLPLLALLCSQLWAWHRVRPAGHRRYLWLGFAGLTAANVFGLLEVMLHPSTQVRLMVIALCSMWLVIGFIAEGRAAGPRPPPVRE